MQNPKYMIRPLLRRMGRDLIVYNPVHHPMARQAKLLEHYGIDMVLDIGANTGQYARELREIGYRGNIVSFEPLSAAFAELQRWAQHDGKAIAINKAIGDKDTEIEFHIAANSTSSSVLDMLPSHTDAAPQSYYQGTEKATMCRLDSLFDQYSSPYHRTLLKIDTQGFEMSVLQGAEASLSKVKAVQLEMSLVPLYKGQALFSDLFDWLSEKGFQMVGINPMFVHPDTGEVLQVDGFFRALPPA